MKDKSSFSKLLFDLHKRTPLAIKMVLVTVFVGVLVWVVLDYVQSRKLRDIFHAQLSERLSQQAMKDRLNFDKHVKAHLQLVKLFVSQKKFSDYVEVIEWDKGAEFKFYRRPPIWFPKLSVLRAFAQPRYAILADSEGVVREIYSGGHGDVPGALLKPSNLLFARSNGQNFITEIDGLPFIIVSKSYKDLQGELIATLMLVSPIDDHFLSASAGMQSEGHVVALLTQDDKPEIVMSSNLENVLPGVLLETIEEEYLVTGGEFFDYGAAEQPIKFVSLISKREVETLTRTVFVKERQHRAIAAPIFIVFFTFIMLWITRRIQRLATRISDFSEKDLGVPLGDTKKGDQLIILEERFQHLTEEVLKARDRLQRETEEKILLEKRQIAMEQKERQLELLQSVTETLGVGVVIKGVHGMEAANKQMEHFIEICGGTAPFNIDDSSVEERAVIDNRGVNHIFEVTSHKMFDESIVLVRDITELKAHTELLEHMALHDPLTALPNRTLFYDRMENAIYQSQRNEKMFAMLMIDLDGFKLINDTMGHHVGDLVLQEVSKRMLMTLRRADTVARLGGDEFAVLLLSVDGVDDSKDVAFKLLEEIKKPMTFDGETLTVGASIGVVLYPNHGDDPDGLVRNADVSMYVAKKSGRGLSMYNPG